MPSPLSKPFSHLLSQRIPKLGENSVGGLTLNCISMMPNQRTATTRKCVRVGESLFNYSGSKFNSTVDETLENDINNIWPQILWFYRRSLDRTRTEAP